MTPRELHAVLKAYGADLRREHEQQISHAWHVAAFGRMKKLPKHDHLFRKKAPQTPKAMLAVAKMWHARVVAQQGAPSKRRPAGR